MILYSRLRVRVIFKLSAISGEIIDYSYKNDCNGFDPAHLAAVWKD